MDANAGAGTCGALEVDTRPCAQLNLVRSNPEAKTRPQKNATATAAPKRARGKLLIGAYLPELFEDSIKTLIASQRFLQCSTWNRPKRLGNGKSDEAA